ncbi:GNAT family N-acetyltransferase [Actinomadura rupiterrae]|uniref:GNAT family N-acetyltransferase n=1 Tax=Actinomadura rupiterrae TaxID=559627 RepID=UPI0020A2DD26|nr:GNAT family N-acetyltransferase [Actinomadura rupiterrae]MCP2336153.1 RimJ/RimL family protein N-acetyltransferase [Actinomadura rupiterrae]
MFGPLAETLRTRRLVLEPLTVHHADEMAAVLDDPRLHTYIGGEPLSLPDLRARYARLSAGPSPFHQEGWLNWIVRRSRDGRPVGTVQATVTPTETSIAWVIAMPYQGFGFATEAAEALITWLKAHNVRTITASIHPDNTPSKSVAAKLGMHPTPRTTAEETIWQLPL